jgi:hypothetical protein
MKPKCWPLSSGVFRSRWGPGVGTVRFSTGPFC